MTHTKAQMWFYETFITVHAQRPPDLPNMRSEAPKMIELSLAITSEYLTLYRSGF